jgi:alpha-N-arabinofuranosidase
MKAKLDIRRENIVAKVEDSVYSSFIEHMGRAIYTGIYEPGHKTADREGFRQDVIDVVRPLALEYVRYPGGNFVSGYNWRDGIGPKKDRPVRMELAWEAIETNQFGIDEFMSWAEKANIKPMIAVNLGTGTPKEAAELLEYLNAPKGSTSLALLREQNGHPEPYGIDLMCLGNEMDGPWQIGAKTPVEYARIAHETAKLLKLVDPNVKLVACGSSYWGIPTFGTWERTVLRECWDCIDYLSLHTYYADEDDTRSFLSRSQDMDTFIKEVRDIVREIAEEKRSDKKIGLSFDEWNVWYHFRKENEMPPKWTSPRAIDEEEYNQADAVLVSGMLCTLLNNVESVKIACIAQLINVIAPIITVPGGDVMIKSIYYPFEYASNYLRGDAVEFSIDCPTYECKARKDARYMDCAVTRMDGKIRILVNNKSDSESIHLDVSGFEGRMESWTEGGMTAKKKPVCALSDIELAPLSWNVIVIAEN